MTIITDQDSLVSWADNGDTGTLANDITLSDNTGFPATLVDGSVLDGGRYTIFLADTNVTGLFSQATSNSTVTIKNLILDATNVGTMNGSAGLLINNAHGTGNDTTITDCGIIDNADPKDFIVGDSAGGFVGAGSSSAGSHTLTITGCYCIGKQLQANSGGIVGKNSGNGGTMTISNCYTDINTTGNGAGGICGGYVGSTSGTIVIKNCYTTGEINNSNGNDGGICGRNCGNASASGSVSITNCYSAGDITTSNLGGGICGRSAGETVTITNCYAKHSTSTGSGSEGFFRTVVGSGPSVPACEAGNGSFSQSLTGNGILGTYDGDSDIWITSGDFSDGYGLSYFNSSPWDVDTTYTSYTSAAAFAAAGGGGDPHIVTLDGKSYDIKTKKYFKLFDNNNKDSRLIINAQVDRSDLPIWNDKEYMTKIFISHNNDSCIISPGFRGSNAHVIYNSGGLEIIDKKLKLKCDHKKFCGDCKYRIRDNKLLMRHRRKNNHKLLAGTRNRLSIRIDTIENIYDVIIMNVDDDNFNPSQIRLNAKSTENIELYNGATVNTSDDYSHDIDNLFTIN